LNSDCDYILGDFTGELTATDNCASSASISVSQSPSPGTIFSGHGTIQTVTLTANDGNGNTASCTFTVTLQDDIAPAISCPSDINVPTDGTACTAIVTYNIPVGTDNCNATTSQSDLTGLSSGDPFPMGTTTLEYTVVDDAGNSASCQFNVTVTDQTAPQVASGTPTTINAQCDTTITEPVFTDCSTPVTVTTTDDVSFNDQGTYWVHWVATDAEGNSMEFIQTIQIQDNTSPVFSEQLENDTMLVSDVCTYILPNYMDSVVVSDNCTPDEFVNLSQFPVPGTALALEDSPHLITLFASDQNGQSSSMNFWIVLLDSIAPVILDCPGDMTVSTGTNCEYVIPDYSQSINSTDNCTASDLLDIQQTPTAGTVLSGHGTTQDILYVVTDASGNSTSCSFTLTLEDDTDPVIDNCPSDQFVTTDTLCQYVLPDFTTGLIYSDNCSSAADITVIQSPAPGPGQSGDQVVTIQVIDAVGNESQCVFNVTALDILAPSITCPDTLLRNFNETCAFQVEDYTGLAEVDDNCTASSELTVTQSPAAGEVMSGPFDVALTVTDGSGNSETCSFHVSVEDDMAPVAQCQDLTIYLDENGAALLTPAMVDAGSTDNCTSDALDLNLDQQSFDCSHVNATNEVTLTVTDATGNSNTCTALIEVIDSIAPVLTCPTDTIVYSDQIADSVMITIPLPVVVENCAGYLLENDYTGEEDASGMYPYGETLITWTVENNGQSAQCQTLVTLVPDEDPVIHCDEEIIVSTDPGECGAMVDILVPEFSGPIFSIHEENFDLTSDTSIYLPIGDTELTWVPDNDFFAENTCTSIITVVDTEAPTIIECLADTAHCGLTLDLPLPVVTDNCGYTITNSFGNEEHTDLTFPHDQTTTVTWTISDGTNESTCTTTVLAVDNTVLANAGLDQSLNATFETLVEAWVPSHGQGYWTVTEGSAQVIDSASAYSVVTNLGLGNNILTWTVESDVCGTSTDNVNIHVREFMIPTAFSPNGDGYNDLYRIIGIESIPENSFQVFNTWGRKVYSARNYTNEWDGRNMGGKDLPNDTYYFILEVKGDTPRTFKGYIELRR
ncbi:MAG: HYR domain-containing protein, partial [Flavobacteriales bacterium]|nr:HYR domain-containing protein [Flavobacteriales bacterium]